MDVNSTYVQRKTRNNEKLTKTKCKEVCKKSVTATSEEKDQAVEGMSKNLLEMN